MNARCNVIQWQYHYLTGAREKQITLLTDSLILCSIHSVCWCNSGCWTLQISTHVAGWWVWQCFCFFYFVMILLYIYLSTTNTKTLILHEEERKCLKREENIIVRKYKACIFSFRTLNTDAITNLLLNTSQCLKLPHIATKIHIPS